MRLKYYIFFVWTGLFFAGDLYSQQAEELVFTEKTFDFGTVKEEDGPIIHEFSFVNKGINPVKIVSVKASCGCTTPDWTKESVNPGETGFIQAQYNPRNRPGTFNKSLTVTTDASETPLRLYIKGNVVPKTRSVEEDLSTELGGLRVKYRSFNMGKVQTSDQPSVKEFDVYNASEQPIIFSEKVDGPSYIQLAFEPAEIAPKEKGLIKVTYDGKSTKEFGFSSDNIRFYTNEPGEDSIKSISIYATIEEYFPPMTQEDLKKAPRLKLEQNVHDFGRITRGEKYATRFVLVNTGASPLVIRQTKSNCACAKATVEENSLKPGESTEMEVTFDPEGRRGNQQKSITVYTNDPRNSAQRVTLKAYIEGVE